MAGLRVKVDKVDNFVIRSNFLGSLLQHKCNVTQDLNFELTRELHLNYI